MLVEPSAHFNCQLEFCYEVKLYLASLMQQLPDGEVLAFISSDPRAEREVLDWAEWRGYDVLDVQPLADNHTRFLIRRSDHATF